MLSAKKLLVPMGVGLCILNNYKDKLRLHGAPHQRAGGMSLNECYDKFGGETRKMSELDTVEACSEAKSDTMYDHDAGNIESQNFVVECTAS